MIHIKEDRSIRDMDEDHLRLFIKEVVTTDQSIDNALYSRVSYWIKTEVAGPSDTATKIIKEASDQAKKEVYKDRWSTKLVYKANKYANIGTTIIAFVALLNYMEVFSK